MKRKGYIIILCLVAAAITAAAVWYFVSREKTQEGQEGMITNEHPTDGPNYFEDNMPPADPMMVGKWRSIDKKGWYKVYYDDYDEDTKKFWGKEWDEAEDVHEEDLNYHGNGWFRWEKHRNELREYATMDAQDMPIHRKYELKFVSPDTVIFCEPDYKVRFKFVRD